MVFDLSLADRRVLKQALSVAIVTYTNDVFRHEESNQPEIAQRFRDAIVHANELIERFEQSERGC